jgi:hypothetical protein
MIQLEEVGDAMDSEMRLYPRSNVVGGVSVKRREKCPAW